jgi:hypothetical protein
MVQQLEKPSCRVIVYKKLFNPMAAWTFFMVIGFDGAIFWTLKAVCSR